MKLFIPFLFLLAFFWSSPSPAYAYLDPGAGSVLLQILLGGIAGLLIMIRLWWRNLLAFFGFARKPGADGGEAGSKPAEP